ncbi:protein VACUOLELESS GAMETOPHYTES-like [Prosopis cineraria]|uniref:protein VACUOLELESS GAMETOPHYTES-like n=1 Tax=Prosopis cineraria TaxID=364024 RepID=UPI0024101C90|nr:protein VACUOLELESS GAMETOPHYTES-like [Prosopis cineraria]
MGSDFEETMNHPCHLQHPIILKSEGAPFQCSGCKELGFGPRYQCHETDCPFVLHYHCATVRPTDRPRIHLFMGNRRFDFLWEPPGGPNRRYCDACGQDVRGFLYQDQYSKHNFDLHPCCMNLKRTISDPNGTVELNLKDKVPSKCVKCKRKGLNNVQSKEAFRGWSYVSSCGNYCYHVYCVKTLILEN